MHDELRTVTDPSQRVALDGNSNNGRLIDAARYRNRTDEQSLALNSGSENDE